MKNIIIITLLLMSNLIYSQWTKADFEKMMGEYIDGERIFIEIIQLQNYKDSIKIEFKGHNTMIEIRNNSLLINRYGKGAVKNDWSMYYFDEIRTLNWYYDASKQLYIDLVVKAP